MNLQQRWDRAEAILLRYRQLVTQLEQLPKLPIIVFLDAQMRRKFRRFAARLRAGKVEPRYKNLFTAEQLADLCEAACRRDEFIEKALKELRQLADELRAMVAESDAEIARETMAELLPAKNAAQWLGPDSVAEQRYRDIQHVRRNGQRKRNHPRKPEPPQNIDMPGMDFEVHVRQWISAAELLAVAPEGEPVTRFGDGGRGAPVLLRIGVAEFSWVGSFEGGVTDFTTVQVMPDNRNLLVVANGAGYIVEAITHALVAVLERAIATVVSDDSSPVLLIDHGGTTLEAHGPEGRMWRTGDIGCGGFRAFGAADGVLTFEARQADGEWAEIAIDLATGEGRNRITCEV